MAMLTQGVPNDLNLPHNNVALFEVTETGETIASTALAFSSKSRKLSQCSSQGSFINAMVQVEGIRAKDSFI
jgi:hypothetical protein